MHATHSTVISWKLLASHLVQDVAWFTVSRRPTSPLPSSGCLLSAWTYWKAKHLFELIRPFYAEVEPRASSEQRSISWNSKINGVDRLLTECHRQSPLNRMHVCSCVQCSFKRVKLSGHRVTSLASSLSYPRIVMEDEQENLRRMSSMKLLNLSQPI